MQIREGITTTVLKFLITTNLLVLWVDDIVLITITVVIITYEF